MIRQGIKNKYGSCVKDSNLQMRVIDDMQEQMGNISRELENIRSKGNARYQKHSKNEEQL